MTALSLVVVSLAIAQPVSPEHAKQMTQSRELFTARVRKLLTETCLDCHGKAKTRGGLDLATRETLLKGGDNGPVVVPGKGKESKLYRLAAKLDEPHMPPKAAGKVVTADQLADLAKWIDLGAAYDKPLLERTSAKPKEMVVTEQDRRFWSFAALKRPPLPATAGAWGRTPIDRFVLAKLEEKRLTPAGEADKRTLIRRVTFDLLGLPPTPEEVAAFLSDTRPDAYERLVDRVLASPAYGERWGRHWLDLVRFAESHGFEHDYDRPHAYPYRDFVIRALNLDVGYDDFVKWQVAGDEIEPHNPLAVQATGFLGAGVHSTQITANTVEKERYDELDDVVRTLGTSMLGLTIGCARCHDHKFDPIPTRDYYRVVATFTKTVRSEQDVEVDPVQAREARQRHAAELAEIQRRIDDYKAPEGDRERDPRWWEIKQRHAKLKKRGPAVLTQKAMICSENVPPLRLHTQGGDYLEHTHFLDRGDPNQKGAVATPGYPQVLTRAEGRWTAKPPAGARTPHLRRSLADWLADVDHGAGHLLARVIVNRLWQHHFGRGLVATPSDFGTQGERPTHPELLDWLASELVAQDWRLKPLHRQLVTSAAYRQATTFDKEKALADPENRLLWRRVPRRLEAEVLRDSLLAVAGQLDRRMYGPGTLDAGQRRRSVYFFVKRSQLVPMMTVFDAPDGTVGIEQRTNTTIAPQALLMLNNRVVREAAAGLAERLGDADPVGEAYARALGRPPSARERTAGEAFLREQTAAYGAGRLARVDYAQVLLGLNEFAYVD